MNLDFSQLSNGQPVKTNANREETMARREYSLGYGQASLDAQRQQFEKEQAAANESIARAIQELMNTQARQVAEAAAAGGAMAGLNAGMGMGQPPMGGMPPMGGPMQPGMMPPGAPMGGAPGMALPPGVGEFAGAYDQQMAAPQPQR